MAERTSDAAVPTEAFAHWWAETVAVYGHDLPKPTAGDEGEELTWIGCLLARARRDDEAGYQRAVEPLLLPFEVDTIPPAQAFAVWIFQQVVDFEETDPRPTGGDKAEELAWAERLLEWLSVQEQADEIRYLRAVDALVSAEVSRLCFGRSPSSQLGVGEGT